MDDHPIVKRDVAIRRFVASVLTLAVLAVVMLSQRPLLIGARSWVLAGDPIEPAAMPAGFVAEMDDYAVHIPMLLHAPLLGVPAAAASAMDTPVVRRAPDALRFGYSIQEFDVLGMPFVPYREFGHVIYYETPGEFVAVPVDDAYLRQFRIPHAQPLTAWGFPFWKHMWGWLFVVALLGLGLFELAALRRRRAALDLI